MSHHILNGKCLDATSNVELIFSPTSGLVMSPSEDESTPVVEEKDFGDVPVNSAKKSEKHIKFADADDHQLKGVDFFDFTFCNRIVSYLWRSFYRDRPAPAP